MTGEEFPPPPPSIGAVIKPRNSVNSNPHTFTFDVNDAGEVAIGVTVKRTRKTGRKVIDIDGKEVDEWEAYETDHMFGLTPGPAVKSVEWEDAGETVLKTIRRKHAAQYDEEGNLIAPSWEEDVDYTRPKPARKMVKFADYDLIYDYHDKLLKETIIVHKQCASIRWTYDLSGGKLKKVPGSTDHYLFQTEEGEDLRMKITTPTGEDATGKPMEGLMLFVSAQGQFNLIIPNPQKYEYPLTIDPSFTFDGTDFVIASAQTEIKTFQQLWPTLSGGTDPRYLNGYMTADTDGVSNRVRWEKTFASSIDISSMSDFTITVKTTNADAVWSLVVQMGNDSSNFRQYQKNLANDVDATYTLSDFTIVDPDIGSPDFTTVDFMRINFGAIDTALGANVVTQVKDFKITTPVKTSDMYDSTGRFVLYNEDFEGDDGLALDSYDSNWTVTKGGTSTAEIDDAQQVGGSTSLLMTRDGANNLTATIDKDMVDYTRISYRIRAAQTNARLLLVLRDGAGDRFVVYFNTDGNIVVQQAGANNIGTYVANTWYLFEVDVDIANDKSRVWQDGVLIDDWRAFDVAAAQIDNFKFFSNVGTGSFWVDDLNIHVGFEDFSALTAPHDIDEICESLTPTGTDYGRGTWDGDYVDVGWSDTFAVDNTDVVIGTNSIKLTDSGIATLHGARYQQDASTDITSFTYLRWYMKIDDMTNVDRIQVEVRDSDGDYYYYRNVGNWLSTPSGKWALFELELSASSGSGGTPDFTKYLFTQVLIRTTGGEQRQINVDGFHFYGDEDAGLCTQGNSLDIDGNDFTHDNHIFDLKTIKDTTNGGAFVSTANIEFTDVANAGYNNNGMATITVTGTDEDNHVLWNAVGDTNPTNEWAAQKSAATVAVLTHVTYKYCTLPIFVGNTTLYDVFFNTPKTTPQLQGGSNSEFYKVKVRNSGHATASMYIEQAQVFREADIDGTKANNIWQNTGHTTLFLDSTFDRDYIVLHADGMIISKNHDKGGIYVVAIGANGQAYSNLVVDVPDHLPTPNDIFYLSDGTYTTDVGVQIHIIYRLEGAAGTTVDNTVEGGLVVLDPDLSDVLGTLTQTKPIQLGLLKPPRPIPLPMPRPIIYSNGS